jgi:NAD(P)-dependent dehydrogenase (short-subunit alcohol dehydrogenase family)
MTPKTAIITGGTTGIGMACAQALIARGHHVAIGARRAGDTAVQAHVHSSVGADVMLFPLNVADRASVDAFVARVVETLGTPTILVNAAGIYHEAFLHDHSDAAWDDQIEINLSGAFRMTRAVFSGMIDAGWGRIANIASTAGTKGECGYAAYCASKAGLIGLSKATAVEGAPHGISCIAVSPTWVETPMMENAFDRIVTAQGITREAARAVIAGSNPQGRIVQPAEVAAMVDFFCSQAAPGLTNVDIQINAGADW